MVDKAYNLAEFKACSKEDWLEKVKNDLKGKELDSLNWQFEKKSYSPFYNKEDLSTRKKINLNISGSTLNLQYFNSNGESFKEESLNALNNGADGIICEVDNNSNFIKSLGHLLPQHCHLSIQSPNENLQVFKNYQSYLGSLSSNQIDIHGLGFWNEILKIELINGDINFNSELASEIIIRNKFPNFKNLQIDVSLLKLVNPAPSYEIALSLSLMVYMINELLDNGIPIEKVAANIFFKLKTSTKYFIEIAKLRVYRVLVMATLNEYEGVKEVSPHFHVEIFSEAENELLSQTTAAMSTLLAGADSLVIVPSTTKKQDQRIARNVMNILNEESYLIKANDPSSGAYFIESLTNDLAKSSWDIFREIESNGGIKNCIKSGMLNEINEG